ncbi:MAG: Gfo/Idh/MocA family oxidoreductase [Pirellulaceae bacterium]|nr:Gfo/Idh/MocA family oxidoreductase [Pirellulaceae bacterium]
MDRRTFVCGVASFALGTGARVRAEGAASAASSRSRLRIGFLGAAYSHAAPKLALLRDHRDFELVGAWDDDPQVRDRLSAQGIPTLSQDEVLSRSEVIAVESVVRAHARYARIALAAGKHVHLEKPPSVALAEFREVVQLARDKRLVLQGGYQYRHHPGLNAVMEAVREGWLGDIFMVRATMNNQLAVERRAEWAE